MLFVLSIHAFHKKRFLFLIYFVLIYTKHCCTLLSLCFRCCTLLCFQHCPDRAAPCPLVSMDSELEIVPGRATPASPAAEQLLPSAGLPVSAGAGLRHVLLYNLTPPLLVYLKLFAPYNTLCFIFTQMQSRYLFRNVCT